MIAMCLDSLCPSRDRCYRHEASGTKPKPHQAYANMKRLPDETQCFNFWPVETRPNPVEDRERQV
jgi:hypothetical protein